MTKLIRKVCNEKKVWQGPAAWNINIQWELDKQRASRNKKAKEVGKTCKKSSTVGVKMDS